MKKTAKFFSAALAVVMLVSGTTDVRAEDYTYEVTLYAGEVGTVDGGKKVVVEDIKNGGCAEFKDIRTTVGTDKYYVKGFRVAGTDTSRGAYSPVAVNEEGRVTFAIDDVTEDIDLVLVYGVAAKKITYQVVYLNKETGEPLAAPSTFVGSAGDNPIATAVYVEGYVPTFDQATKTLVDGKDNTIRFEYVPTLTETEYVDKVTTKTKTETVIITNRVPGNAVVRPTNPTTPVNDNTTPGGTPVIDQNDDNNDNPTVEPGKDNPDEPGTEPGGEVEPGKEEDPSTPGTEPGSEGGEKDPTEEVDPEPTPGANNDLTKNPGIAIAGGSLLALIILFLIGKGRKKA